MQRAESILFFVAAITLLGAADLAQAQSLPATAEPTPDMAPAQMALPQGDAKPQLGAAARAVQIGRTEVPSAPGSIKELENLQREAFLGDLRAKIRESQGAAGRDATSIGSPVGAPLGGVPLSGAVSVSPQPASRLPGDFAATPVPYPALPGVPPLPGTAAAAEANNEPSAQYVSIVSAAGKTRADVFDAGVIRTVREGDHIGNWTVASIRGGAVVVEKVVTERRRDAAAKQAKKGAKPAAVIVTERTVSASLKPYNPPPAFVVQASPAAPQAIAAPQVPPLPAGVADSTGIAPATPLR